ncbi:MAG: hypothetical protein KF832_20555 [Caldilineaceae bacterium]|nr:hypothetical protein [Caldilineaceae bacterium]
MDLKQLLKIEQATQCLQTWLTRHTEQTTPSQAVSENGLTVRTGIKAGAGGYKPGVALELEQ